MEGKTWHRGSRSAEVFLGSKVVLFSEVPYLLSLERLTMNQPKIASDQVLSLSASDSVTQRESLTMSVIDPVM